MTHYRRQRMNVSALLCALSGLTGAGLDVLAETVLETESLKVAFSREGPGSVDSIFVKAFRRTFTNIRLDEEAVFQDGRTVPITGYEIVKSGVAGAAVYLAHLPENPLIGAVPHRRLDIPYFRSDETHRLRIKKTIRPDPQEAVLHVDYEVSNTGDSNATFCLLLGRRFAMAETTTRSLVPSIEGVTAQGFSYEYDTSGSWLANTGKGMAVVTEMDASWLSCISRSKKPGFVTTEITLGPGEQWKTSTRTMFVNDLTFVSDYRAGIAVAIAFPPAPEVPVRTGKKTIEQEMQAAEEVTDEAPGLGDAGVSAVTLTRKAFLPGKPIPLKLHFRATTRRTVTVHGKATRLLYPEPQVDLGKHTIDAGPSAVKATAVKFTPPLAGTWLIRFRATEGGKDIGSFEAPLVVDFGTGFYLPGLERAIAKKGKVFERYRWERTRKPNSFDPHSSAVPFDKFPKSRGLLPISESLPGGPLKVLMSVPFAEGRRARELKQLLDLDIVPVLVGGHGYPNPTALKSKKKKVFRAPPDEVRAMRRGLNQPSDLILLAGTFWGWFPEDVQQEILRQVSERRAGLLFWAPATLPDIPQILKENDVDPTDTEPVVLTYGKGQLGIVKGGDYYRGLQLSEELYRAIVSLTRRDSGVKIDWKSGDGLRSPQRITVRNGSKVPLKGTLRFSAHLDRFATYPSAYRTNYSVYMVHAVDRFSEKHRSGQAIDVPPGGEMELVFAADGVPPGTYLTSAAIENRQGETAAWIRKELKMTPAANVGNVRIEHEKKGKVLRLYQNDTARVSFSLEFDHRPPANEVTAFLKCTDRSLRLVAAESKVLVLEENAATAEFVFPLIRSLHLMNVVQVGAELNGRIIGEHRVPLLVARTPERANKFRFSLLDNENWLPMNFMVMDDHVGPYDPYVWAWFDIRLQNFSGFFNDPFALPKEVVEKMAREKAAKEAGNKAKDLLAATDTGIGNEAEVDDLGLDDDFPLVEEEKPPKKKEKPEPVFVRNPCFDDPRFIERRKRDVRKLIAGTSAGWAQECLLVDEYSYGNANASFSDGAIAGFKEYVRKVYGTIDALNAEWGSRYKGFNEVEQNVIDKDFTPPKVEDWPRAVDTLTYKVVQMTDFAEQMGREAKSIDPQAEVGFSGVHKMTPFNGMDFWLMSQAGGRHKIYRDLDEWQSFCKPGAVVAWGSGYGRNFNPSQQQAHPWYLLVRDTWGVGHFTSPGYPMADPWGNLNPGPQRFFDEFDKVRKGPAELLLGHSVRDGVAIHWSGPSFFVYGMEWWAGTKKRGTFQSRGGTGGPMMDWPRRQGHAFHGLVASYQGLRPHYLGYGDLHRGGFGRFGKPKVILLPYSTAMSESEAATLKEFVREGGVMVSCVNTATRSVHGRPLETPLLDEVLGIERTGGFQPPFMKENQEDLRLNARVKIPDSEDAIEFEPIVVGPTNLKLTTGAALGKWGNETLGGPAFILNRFGNGLSLHLNCILPDVNEITRLRPAAAAWEAIRTALHCTTCCVSQS